jgi:hypothetical protein
MNVLTKKTTQMKRNPIPITGPGKFQWNAGGWFGATLGSSAWMLVTSSILIAHHQPWIASIAASGFLANLVVSLVLWNFRDRVSPFPALMTILGFMAFTLPLVWLIVQTYASPESKNAMNWPVSRWSTVFVLILVPALMFWFTYLERLAKLNHQSPPLNPKSGA